jgi:hypothetical protein
MAAGITQVTTHHLDRLITVITASITPTKPSKARRIVNPNPILANSSII